MPPMPPGAVDLFQCAACLDLFPVVRSDDELRAEAEATFDLPPGVAPDDRTLVRVCDGCFTLARDKAADLGLLTPAGYLARTVNQVADRQS